jgi:hypothetical protein
MFDDTKGLIRNRKDRHYNGQTKKDKKTNNDLRNTTQKTKDSSFLLRVACDLNKDWKVKKTSWHHYMSFANKYKNTYI